MTRWLAALCTLCVFAVSNAAAGPRAAAWKKVREAIGNGLPKSAVAELEPIVAGAVADQAWAEAVKAVGQKIALEGSVQGEKAEEKILRLEAAIPLYPSAMKPALEAILAHWYWQYFKQNRHRFLQRTQTAGPPGNDLQSWDLPRILAEIDRHFSAALADTVSLQAIPVASFDALLVKGAMPDRYRPTLFDFLAHEALAFYRAGEQGAAAAEEAFVLDAGSPIFDATDRFMDWQPDTADETSPTLKAVRLYQKLLAFHRDDPQRDAFIDLDLDRLIFGRNQAAGEDKTRRFTEALDRFVSQWPDHEVSARALAEWAKLRHEAGDFLEARKLARRGLDRFPESAGGTMCFNLIGRIEAKSAGIRTERIWNAPWPTVDVTYRNITRVFFRAVREDFEKHLENRRWGLYNFDDAQRRELLDRRPDLEWSAVLPATADFKERIEKLPSPQTLPAGFYFIIASHDPSFGERENQVSIAAVWVSDLALVMRQRSSAGAIEGFVLDALSGEPLPGASVQAWQRNKEGRFKPSGEQSSDRDGFFRFASGDGKAHLIVARLHGRQIATDNEWSAWRRAEEKGGSRTVFFTDRALYRPGQTIYYKGIHLRSDPIEDRYETVASADITVTFHDPNGQEIARALHKTNDYGSFDGAFSAPRDRLLGRMVIRGPGGESSFNVEEYKRPKFHVELEAPREAAKLSTPVTLGGKAAAYTGAAIGGAKVKWRVVREIQLPPWCWWGFQRIGPAGRQAINIAHGSAVTGADGSFAITFDARPDPAVTAAEEPTFTYRVSADVSDASGETRSAERRVRAGFTALQATLDSAEWQTADRPVALTIATASRDGEPQGASGRVTIFALRQPEKVVRAALEPPRPQWHGDGEPEADPANPDSWETGPSAGEIPFATGERGEARLEVRLEPGIYRAVLETADRFGRKVAARRIIQVVDPRAERFAIRRAHFLSAPRWSVAPGESFLALWGTGYETGRAFVELECRGETLRRFWTGAGRTQERIEQPVSEKMRGGFTLRITHVRENRAYLSDRIVDVPWDDKSLVLRWEHFTSKLGPAQRETWSALITGPDGQRAVAEMVAGLYDASLDQYRVHQWPRALDVFRRESERVNGHFENTVMHFQRALGGWSIPSRQVAMSYRSMPPELTAGMDDYGPFALRRSSLAKMSSPAAAPSPVAGLESKAEADAAGMAAERQKGSADDRQDTESTAPAPDLDKIAARRNLNETAFFFPRLTSDAEGVVKITFEMPEALTEWRFMGFAHDRALRSGFLEGKTVTAKDLMVEPNPPRFVREGDQIEFSVKVSNQSDLRQKGRLRLTMADVRTLEGRDEALGNRNAELGFDLPAKESRSYTWRLAIPDGCGFLTYKAVASTGALSDGEEGHLPVLSRRILVSESLPLPVRGIQTFTLDKLIASGTSDTLRHQALTVQMVSQPAWYAVMALPVLMEYPYECSEQVFNRLYANALARHIATADPRIRRIFDQWKGTAALESPLEKNQDLKSVLLEETPWLRQAIDESQARRNVGLLFDDNRLAEETARTLTKLAEMQGTDGRWPWFPGGWGDDYITLYIVTGFGRLRHMGVEIDVAAARRALAALDGWMDARYRRIKDRDRYVPGSADALYLYGRSFFLQDLAIAAPHREAVDFFLRQSRKFWLQVNERQSQAHLALALKRFERQAGLADTQGAKTAVAIMRSLDERSVRDGELGMFWRDTEQSWWWARAPIETQAVMIEAFGEVTGDRQAVEDCRVWLLKQKQTQGWKTTKATADAVYALLLGGANLLASDAVEIALGGQSLRPEKVEAGTGFTEHRFGPGQITPAMGQVALRKTDEGVAWGSLHWQYLEEMTKITPHQDTPLRLIKTLWVKETTSKGPLLKPLSEPLSVGDELVVRIELRSDRDMEYLHLKDQRGSGTEPLDVLSRYTVQDGLRYYQSTRDTASHFFIDYLPKGVYLFEYGSRIQHKGRYQSGIAEIQCMYAPEFNSHSGSHAIEVR